MTDIIAVFNIDFYLQNYQLKLQQEVHYKTLVQSSKQYEEEQDKAKVVERDEVEEALTEKLKLQRQFVQQLKGKSLHFLVSVERFHKLLECF